MALSLGMLEDPAAGFLCLFDHISILPLFLFQGLLCILANNTFNTVQALSQRIHARTIREADIVMAGAVEQITASGWVQVEKDARHDNNLFFQTGLKEVETVGNGIGKTIKIQPPIRRERISIMFP